MKSQIRDKMIDATDTQQFCMMLKKETKPHITRLSKGEKVSWNNLLCLRNYILTGLLVAGAPRSGVITGFTLQQFRKATKLTKDDGSDYWVANVDDHKTATSHGPPRLVFNDEVYSLARVYADYGRVQTASVTSTLVLQDESPFFLENKGGKVTRVAAQTIFRLWKSHGFAGNLNPTHIRYTAATKACETLNPVTKRGVATLMAHTVATQEHYYNALKG
ncbi:uncharacterized protein [Apostichopus japonicus]|uniref:uncharacterized protein n=1 Tax=Stichopus japonicus TaxID=307972 RepID=UPI003AB7D091